MESENGMITMPNKDLALMMENNRSSELFLFTDNKQKVDEHQKEIDIQEKTGMI